MIRLVRNPSSSQGGSGGHPGGEAAANSLTVRLRHGCPLVSHIASAMFCLTNKQTEKLKQPRLRTSACHAERHR